MTHLILIFDDMGFMSVESVFLFLLKQKGKKSGIHESLFEDLSKIPLTKSPETTSFYHL